jgi:uncharacterized repeat protein (TIGR01451 family)
VVALVLVVATPVSLRATPAGGRATTLVPKSDMQVTVTASAGFATGFTGTYTITAVNNGPQSAPGPITITDTLPAGLTYNSVTAPGGWTCTNTVQVVSCTLPGALAKNVTQTFTIVANITAAAAASVTNIVTASDVANDDTNLANNRATVTSAVTVRTATSPGRFAAQSTHPPPEPAVKVVMKSDSPPRAARFSELIRPPCIFASKLMSLDVASIAPDSTRICSLGASVARATANAGSWRTVISMAAS